MRCGTLKPVLAETLKAPEVEPRRKGRVVLGGLITWPVPMRLSLGLLSIIIPHMAEKAKLLGGVELTVDDLEESNEKKLTGGVGGYRQDEGSHGTAGYAEQSGSVISILKKKPPNSPSVSFQASTDKKVNFSKDTPPTVPFKPEPETRIHQDCPCCTCHTHSTSLKSMSLLQSVSEKNGNQENLLELASLMRRNYGIGGNGGGVTMQRAENSPSQVFRARFNQRLMKQARKIDSVSIPDSAYDASFNFLASQYL